MPPIALAGAPELRAITPLPAGERTPGDLRYDRGARPAVAKGSPVRLDRFRRPSAAAAVAAAAAVLALGACGTSFNAQTNQRYQAGIGADLRDSPVQVLGALLVSDEEGNATLSATLLNKSGTDQRLTDARLVDSDGKELELTSTSPEDLVLTADTTRTLGSVSNDNEAQQSKVYTTSDVTPGLYYTLALTFDEAGEVEIHLPSVVRSAIYEDVAPAPTASEDAPQPEGAEPEGTGPTSDTEGEDHEAQ